MNTGKCPKCNFLISTVEVEAIDITENLKSEWKGASYLCPSCRVVLGVGFDPLALATHTATQVLEKLRHQG